MNLENIQNLSTDLLALLKEYERLKDIESRTMGFQLTKAQQDKIHEIMSIGHRSTHMAKLCSGNLSIMLPLSHATGGIKEAEGNVVLVYCAYCSQRIYIDAEGRVL